jgi:hypothetical protein
MRKKFLIATLLAFFAIAAGTGTALARDYGGNGYNSRNSYKSNPKFKAGYTNIAFAWQSIHLDTGLPEADRIKLLLSDWGLSFSTGQSFILNREPIAGMLRFGIDATWFDFNIARLSLNPMFDPGIPMDSYGGGGYSGQEALRTYQTEFSMGIGLSAHLNPIGNFGLHTYVRYNPTVTLFTDFRDSIEGGYTSGIIFGGAVSWDTISLGVEGRWGFGSYKDWSREARADADYHYQPGQRLKTRGGRIYLGFRF